MSAGLRSGELAVAAGVNVQTLRYYERPGLLAEPERTLGGHWVYAPEDVTVLRVIKAAQRLGDPAPPSPELPARWRGSRSWLCLRPGTPRHAVDLG